MVRTAQNRVIIFVVLIRTLYTYSCRIRCHDIIVSIVLLTVNVNYLYLTYKMYVK